VKTNIDILQEFLDLAPTNLEKFGSVGGTNIYSNEKIITYIINWLSKSSRTKLIADKLIQGIRDRKILIGYESRSKIKFLLTRWKHFRKPTSGKFVLGYFSKEDGQIAILLDSNVDLFGKSVREIPPVLTHEFMHFLANKDVTQFLRGTMNDTLLPFYREICNKISKSPVHDIDLIKTIIDISKFSDESNSRISTDVIISFWYELFNKSNDKDSAVEMSKQMLAPYSGLLMDKYLFNRSITIDIARYFYKAYENIGVKNPEKITLVGQEALYPSEVICISNQFGIRQDAVKMVKKIRI